MFAVLLAGLWVTAQITCGARAEPVSGGSALDAVTAELIGIMRAHHPLLTSQRAVVEAVRSLPLQAGGVDSLDLSFDVGLATPDGGEPRWLPSVGLQFGIPLASRAEATVRNQLARVVELEQARQALERMEAELTGALVAKVEEIAHTAHLVRSRIELLDVLQDRTEEVERLVRLGSAAPRDLWDLMERMTNLRTEMLDLEARRALLVRQTAEVFGGDEAEAMRSLLVQAR